MPVIEQSEFEDRWRAVSAACSDLGLDGLIVWSRGGASVDGYADAFYLSHYYPAFPLAENIPPIWSGRGHAAVFVPHDEDPVLFMDEHDWREDLVSVSDVRPALNVPLEVSNFLREKSDRYKRLGFGGRNNMVLDTYLLFRDSLQGIELVDADDLVPSLRREKSPREQELLRASASVGSEVMNSLMRVAVQPGRTEADAVEAAFSTAIQSNVAVYDIVVASGPNTHFYAYSKFPCWSNRVLEEGDLLHVDMYGALDGYLYDFSRTAVVGGRPNADQRRVVEGSVNAVNAMLHTLGAGVEASSLYRQSHTLLTDEGLLGGASNGELVAAVAVDFPAFGHGLGLSWERPWLTSEDSTVIEPNMCLALEAHAGIGGVGSSLFEQDVLVTEAGVEVLTSEAVEAWWD